MEAASEGYASLALYWSKTLQANLYSKEGKLTLSLEGKRIKESVITFHKGRLKSYV